MATITDKVVVHFGEIAISQAVVDADDRDRLFILCRKASSPTQGFSGKSGIPDKPCRNLSVRSTFHSHFSKEEMMRLYG
ncbi:MAG: hypothetical protein AAF903_12190 [Pseudomonadota bacterium]